MNYTKAGGACGRCKGVIKDILDTYWGVNKKANSEPLTTTQKILKISKVIEQQICHARRLSYLLTNAQQPFPSSLVHRQVKKFFAH